MATFGADIFTGTNGTNLTGHTSGVDGTTWAKVGAGQGNQIIQTNALAFTSVSGTGATYKNSGVPATPHQIVTEHGILHTQINMIAGPTARTQTVGDTYYYMQANLSTGGGGSMVVSLRKRVNNIGSNLTDLTCAALFPAAHEYDYTIKVVGGTITTVSGIIQDTTTGNYLQPDGTFGASAVEFASFVDMNGIVAAGGAGLRNGSVNSTSTTGWQAISFTAIDFNIPATGVGITGAINGTAGIASQPVYVYLTPSGLCAGDVITPHASAGTVTFTPSSVTLDTNDQRLSFTVNAAAAGSFNITLTDTLGLTMPAAYPFTAYTAVIVYPYADPVNCYHSTVSWFEDGTSAIVANSNWAEVKMGFTGTGCLVTVDVSPFMAEGVMVADYPSLFWEIDNGALQSHQLTSSDTTVTLASGLTAGSHTLWLYYYMPDYNATYNVWEYGLSGYWLKINNFILDALASTVAPFNEITVFADWGLTICDSMGNLRGRNPLSNMYINVFYALGVEAVGRNFSATGYNKDGTAPNATIFWPLHDSVNSLLVNGLFVTPPKYVIINEGTNDTSATAGQITAMIAAVRAACGTYPTFIFVCDPFSGHNSINQADILTVIAAGVANYQAGAPSDLRTFHISLPTLLQLGLKRVFPPASLVSADDTHLSDTAQTRYATALLAAIKDKLAAAAVTAGTGGSWGFSKF